LIYHDTYDHNLISYVDRLDEREPQLLSPENEASLDLMEYHSDPQNLIRTCHQNVKELQEHLWGETPTSRLDPDCRYAFLHAPNSRDRLYTSRALLTYLLTYHQVMPSILDFLFPFGRQEYARDLYFSGFRHETRLESIYKELNIHELGRSGRELRMCYSLKAVEPTEYNPSTPWSIRQTVVYHSLDVETERAFWIVIKGDELIKDRIEDTVRNPVARKTLGGQSGKKSNAFTRSLATHMIVCDWCGADWRWYINYLEECTQDRTRSTLSATAVRSPPVLHEKQAKSVTWSTTTSTLREKHSIGSNSTFKNLSTRSQGFGRSKGSLNSPPSAVHDGNRVAAQCCSTQSAQLPSEPFSPPTTQPLTASNFSFADLQSIQYLQDMANEIFIILNSNIQVLGELREYYRMLLESPCNLFRASIPEVEKFLYRVLDIISDLEMQKARTKALLRLLADRKSLLHGILEYQNIEASGDLARRSQVSAQNMEVMTREMHVLARKTTQETVSMRIITLVTLFFLPGTFISTIMSTDIVKFEINSDGQSREIFQAGALQLFITICFPLMAVTFVAWYGVYWWVNRKDERKRSKSPMQPSVTV